MEVDVTILDNTIYVVTDETGRVTVTGDDPSPGQAGIYWEDEGVALGTRGTVDEIDFVGAGVSVARVIDKLTVTVPYIIIIACSDETTALSAGAGKLTFRMPRAMTLTAVRASLTTAQTSGNIFTVDINDGGTTILSTKLTIDNTEKTSTTAVTPAVISDTSLADDAEITIDIDQIGDGTAKGLKVTLIG